MQKKKLTRISCNTRLKTVLCSWEILNQSLFNFKDGGNTGRTNYLGNSFQHNEEISFRGNFLSQLSTKS